MAPKGTYKKKGRGKGSSASRKSGSPRPKSYADPAAHTEPAFYSPYQSTPKRKTALMKPGRIATRAIKSSSPKAATHPLKQKASQKSPSPKQNNKAQPKPSPKHFSKQRRRSDENRPSTKQKKMTTAERSSPRKQNATTVYQTPTKSRLRAAGSSSDVYTGTRSSTQRRRSYNYNLRESFYIPARDKISSPVNVSNTSQQQSSGAKSSNSLAVKRRRRSPSTAGSSVSTRRSISGTDSGSSSKRARISSPSSRDHVSPAAAVSLQLSTTRAVNLQTPVNTPFKVREFKSLHRPFPQEEQKSQQLYSKEQHSLWNQQLSEMLNTSWRLCYMSDLINFDIHTANLKSAYQKTLRNKLSDGLAFSVQVSLEPRNCFSCSLTSTDAVLLTITYSIPQEWDMINNPVSKKTKEKKKQLYKSLLFKADLRDSQAEQSGMSCYPIYLYKGKESIHLSVVNWLQDSFGCYISQREMRSTALLWTSGLCHKQSCGTDKRGKETVVLSYGLVGLNTDGWQNHRRNYVNTNRNPRSTIAIQLPASHIRKIATCITSSETKGCLNAAERDLFHSILHQLIEDITCLPQSSYRLQSIKTSCLTLSRTGQVRVTCRRHLLKLVEWLLDLHREESLLDQVNPNYSGSESDILESDEENAVGVLDD